MLVRLTYIKTTFQKPFICIQGGYKHANLSKSPYQYFSVTVLSYKYNVYNRVKIT